MQTEAEWVIIGCAAAAIREIRGLVYTRNERGHRPHAHVFYGGAEVVIFIGLRAEVRENPGAMKVKDVREAQLVVAEHHAEQAETVETLQWLKR